MWSSELAKAVSPYRETLPYVGGSPTRPQKDAGWRMDPPVTVPSATTEVPCATPARPTRHAVERHGIAHRSEGRVLGGRAHGELVAIGLAQNPPARLFDADDRDRKSTRLNSSHLVISYAV